MTAEPDQDVGRLTGTGQGTTENSHARGRVEPVGETPTIKNVVRRTQPDDNPTKESQSEDHSLMTQCKQTGMSSEERKPDNNPTATTPCQKNETW